MKKLEVGDRVRVYETGGTSRIGVVSALTNTNNNQSIAVAIEGCPLHTTTYPHPKQCRRLKPRKPKPEKRERVVRWLAGDCEWQCSPTKEAAEKHREQFIDKARFHPPVIRLVECAENEVPVSREALRVAYEKASADVRTWSWSLLAEHLGLSPAPRDGAEGGR